jgi:hypothetical protein
MVTEYAALIEPVEDRFRAVASAPFGMTAFGATEAEALERLDAEVRELLRHGARIVHRRIADRGEHPLAAFAGDLAGDPHAAEWRQAMEEYRQEVENDPDYS